jgi:hypothetical protein
VVVINNYHRAELHGVLHPADLIDGVLTETPSVGAVRNSGIILAVLDIPVLYFLFAVNCVKLRVMESQAHDLRLL